MNFRWLYLLSLFTTNTVAMDNAPIIPVAIGEYHCLLMSDEREVFSYGSGKVGALGHGNNLEIFGYKTSPKLIEHFKGLPVRAVAAGCDYSLVLLNNGTVYSFGGNYHKQLGRQDNAHCNPHPLMIEGLKSEYIVQIAASNFFACALTKEGKAFLWGRKKADTEQIIGLKDKVIQKITCGRTFISALDINGDLWIMEFDENRQDYWQGTLEEPYRVFFKDGRKIEDMATGQSHGIALAKDKTVHSFALYRGDPFGVREATQFVNHIPDLDSLNITKVVAGDRFSAVLSNKGEVWWFGKMKNLYQIEPAKLSKLEDKEVADIFAATCSGRFLLEIQAEILVYENMTQNIWCNYHKYYFEKFDSAYFTSWTPQNHHLQSEKMRKKLLYIWLGIQKCFTEFPVELFFTIFSKI